MRLPLSWNDVTMQQAIDKYAQSVRPDAPWCPSNIEFIRRMNGLESVDEVRRIVFEASYLVLGLGDVYLGAPVATPVDPRHRLVTTKYNPARTWTAENSVGIGGAYMCVYGMEGPGGYQLFGRTCQMWNTYRATKEFEAGKPWLLRFFDQVRFYPVSSEELIALPRRLPRRDRLARHRAGDIQSQGLSRLSRCEWRRDPRLQEPPASGLRGRAGALADDRSGGRGGRYPAPASRRATTLFRMARRRCASPVPGSVWKLAVTQGARVAAGDVLVVVESMKMEMSVVASVDGIVHEVRCAEGRSVALGQTLIVLTEAEAEAAQ